MRRVIYSLGVSLDGFIAGPAGEIDWSAPDEELHRFHNEQTLELGAHFCGRRYEDMVYSEADGFWSAVSQSRARGASPAPTPPRWRPGSGPRRGRMRRCRTGGRSSASTRPRA